MSIVEPHFETTQSGASRSVSPAIERRARRFWDARKSGEESWYLSANRIDGSVR